MRILTATLLSICLVASAATEAEIWQQAIDRADVQTLQRLTASVADVNAAAAKGKTALMVAAAEGSVSLVNQLIDLGAAVDQRNHAAGTALMYTAQYDRVEVARVLIDRGAAVNLTAMKGWSALMIAVLKGHTHMVELLLANGADGNVRDMHGWTPLMRAVEKGDVELTGRLLQEKEIDVNAQSNTGTTALHLAAGLGSAAIIPQLLQHGARMDMKDTKGNTAAMLAEQSGHPEIVTLLR